MTRLIKYLFIAIICLFSYLFPQNGKLNGLQIEWDEDEDKRYEGTYKDGKGVDEREWGYYRNGQMRYEGTYKDGNYDGLWTYWYINGQKKSKQDKNQKINRIRNDG